jgi:glycosyltransferase involved in cell wall biosynthesis
MARSAINPHITVLVCTYNRCECIKDTLEDLLAQQTNDQFTYEVIVVDNNSKDKTREIVASYLPKFSDSLQYLFEPTQGKSYALNRGIQAAQGEIIACIDDDCLLEKNYLLNLYRVFKELPLDVGVLGGKIFPKWMGDGYPAWLDKLFAQSAKLEDGSPNWEKISFEGPIGIMDFGPDPFIIDYRQKDYDVRRFYGANMAFRKKFLVEHGGFDVNKVICEDTEICERLFHAGVKGVYAPNVQVYHKIYAKKVTPAYYYHWRYVRGKQAGVSYQRKFYHPLGIQLTFLLETFDFFKKSVDEKDIYKKVRYRGKGFFNLGQIINVAKQNII